MIMKYGWRIVRKDDDVEIRCLTIDFGLKVRYVPQMWWDNLGNYYIYRGGGVFQRQTLTFKK